MACPSSAVLSPSLLPSSHKSLSQVAPDLRDPLRISQAALGGCCLSVLFLELLRRHDLVARMDADGFPIDVPKLTVYMRHIEDNYGDNAYHNRMHAADVVLSASLFFTEPLSGIDAREGASSGTLAHMPSALELFATLFAAAIHDFCHPGTTNAHEARKDSALALTHHYESTLESHHLASALADLLKPAHNFVRCSIQLQPKNTTLTSHQDPHPRPGLVLGHTPALNLHPRPVPPPPPNRCTRGTPPITTNFAYWFSITPQTGLFVQQDHSPVSTLQAHTHGARVQPLTPRTYRARRCMLQVVDLVLMTDLAKHFEFVKRLGSAPAGSLLPSTELKADKTRMQILLVCAIKAADLGHATKPFALHHKWSTWVSIEFYKVCRP